MFDIPVLLAIIVLVALIFDFTNGAHDCANAIATVVSTKVVTPRFAVGAAEHLQQSLFAEQSSERDGRTVVTIVEPMVTIELAEDALHRMLPEKSAAHGSQIRQALEIVE